jgi:hypothetical protein
MRFKVQNLKKVIHEFQVERKRKIFLESLEGKVEMIQIGTHPL